MTTREQTDRNAIRGAVTANVWRRVDDLTERDLFLRDDMPIDYLIGEAAFWLHNLEVRMTPEQAA